MDKELNNLALSFDEMKLFFFGHGFITDYSKGIARANLYGRRELRWMSAVAPFYLRCLNYVFSILKLNQPSYFLFELRNAQQGS